MKPIDFRQDLLPLKDKIFRVGLRITLNAQEAEDLTQDTLIKAWSRREELAKVDNIEAYCIATCRNMALDRMALKENASGSLESGDYERPDNARTPEEQVEHDDALRRVNQILQSLPEKLRTAVQLRDIEGLSYQQAAQAMEMTEQNFKVTLHRARTAIKTQFEKLDHYGL